MDYQELWHRLVRVYDANEAKAVARMLYEVRYGLTLADLLMGRDSDVPQDELERLVTRLESGEPVQYVLGQADFCGRPFHVEPGVLIPRPETEELCRWIIEHSTMTNHNILDIGTGSGCIAVTLALELPDSQVSACDISDTALRIAKDNAERLGVAVNFKKTDILHLPTASSLPTPSYDLIVSNPPYICDGEAAAMESNVLDHEPHTALFVPDNDPLLFYRAIAHYGTYALKAGEWLYFEINPLYVEALHQLLKAMSYHNIETKADQYGKPRMMRARKSEK